MGRITIFSANDCDDSICVLAALDKMDIPYNEINVSLHPERRRDLLSLTGRLSLPQVFLNRQLLGGADETIKMLKHWQSDKKALGITPRERFAFEIERQPYPMDPRLAPPSDSSSCCSPHANPQQQDEEQQKPIFVGRRPPQASDALVLPNGSKTTVVEMMELLKRILPIQDHTYHMRAYRDCFLGSEAVRSLSEHYQISLERAVKFGRYLQDRHILDHVVSEHDFEDTGYFYRLHCHQTPHVLNSYRRWPEGAIVRDCDALLRDLMSLIRWIEMELLSTTSTTKQGGGGGGLRKAQEHPSFHAFEEAVSELQAVDVASMNDQAKTAFGINVYNLMIKYAFVKVGSFGTSDLQRLAFFGQVKFNVGGHVYSFQEWEHGFLRGNKPPSNLFRRPFADQDPRAALVVKKPDVRLHFALNCGARTCPPVKLLSSEHLQTELAIAALHFCQDNANVRLDASNQVVHLSKIFYWFRADFGQDDAQLLAKLSGYVRGSKRRALQKMLADDQEKDASTPVKVAFLDYDWSVNTNSSSSVNKTTTAGGRSPRALRIKGILPRRQSRGPR